MTWAGGQLEQSVVASAVVNTREKSRILLIEDETNLAKAICEGFKADGFDIQHCVSGEEGLFHLSRENFDLIILDIMLPGRSGLEVLQILRQDGRQITVLLLTAKDQLDDKVAGFDSGADDYLVKPFAFAELMARAKALLKRSKAEPALRIKTANVSIDLLTREVRVGETGVDLTMKEFELLEYLVRHRNEVVSREMLANDVWRETSRITPLDNVIDVHMARLRKKLDALSERALIHTMRGVGFIFRDQE